MPQTLADASFFARMNYVVFNPIVGEWILASLTLLPLISDPRVLDRIATPEVPAAIPSLPPHRKSWLLIRTPQVFDPQTKPVPIAFRGADPCADRSSPARPSRSIGERDAPETLLPAVRKPEISREEGTPGTPVLTGRTSRVLRPSRPIDSPESTGSQQPLFDVRIDLLSARQTDQGVRVARVGGEALGATEVHQGLVG